MLRAPSGVTNIAGANAYAAKLAISPTITVEIENVRIEILIHLLELLAINNSDQ